MYSHYHAKNHSQSDTCLRDLSLSADNFRKTLKTHLFRNALGHLAH